MNGQYFMDRIGSFRSTQIMLGDPRDGPRENIITECANLCAMGYEFSSGFDGRGEAGLCNGFAIEGQGDVGDKCILLYPEGPGTIPYITDSGDFTNIYSIADCIATGILPNTGFPRSSRSHASLSMHEKNAKKMNRSSEQ